MVRHKKIFIIIAILVCIIVFFYFFLSQFVFSKERCINRYLNAYIDENFNVVLKTTNIEKNQFITAAGYFDNDDDPYVGIKKFKVIDYIKLNNNSYLVKVDLEYDKMHSTKKDIKYNDKDLYITLKKKKFLYLFDKWYVKKSILKKVYFKVPKDTQVYFDNVKVSEKYIVSSLYEENVVGYKINNLLNKKYEIKIEYPFEYTQTIKRKPSSFLNYAVTIKPTDSLKKELLTSSQKIVDGLFQSMINRKTYDDFIKSLNYGEWEKYLLNHDNVSPLCIKKRYIDIYDYNKNVPNPIVESNTSNFEIEDIYLKPDGLIQVNLKFTYYSKHKNGYDYTSTQRIRIFYIFTDGEFKYQEIEKFNFV
mgnify:CR=1 FL=1